MCFHQFTLINCICCHDLFNALRQSINQSIFVFRINGKLYSRTFIMDDCTKDQFQMNLFHNQFNRIHLLVSLSLSLSFTLSYFFIPNPLCVPSKAIRLYCIRFYRLFYDRWNEISLLSRAFSQFIVARLWYFMCVQFAFVINELLFEIESFICLVCYNKRARANAIPIDRNMETFIER